MPILSKVQHSYLRKALIARVGALFRSFKARELVNSQEGCVRGYWRNADQMCATKGSGLDLSLAIEDFKVILAELKKLK